MNSDDKRLIEVAFPLKQTSLDSVHEKNVRHGHISTLHIWPARRPLAAARAALIATLLPDPGSKHERDQMLEKLGGKIVEVLKRKKLPNGKVDERVVLETVGGILHWGRESNPDIEWFRQKIRSAYGGRAPRVLDPFAGGGAIPFEAMRLGCAATAVDINPVAWFVLKCTLEYPQRLAGKHRALPDFALNSSEFMGQFFKETSKLTAKQLERNLKAVQDRLFPPPDVDLSWHVRAWGWWVLHRTREITDAFYPTPGGQPIVAYLWTRTVKCKNCRSTIPLLKTCWLDKERTRTLLVPQYGDDGQIRTFKLERNAALGAGNAAQRREHDKRLGAGTMTKSGVNCPRCHNSVMTMEEIRFEARAGRMSALMTAVVVEGPAGTAYREVVEEDRDAIQRAEAYLEVAFDGIPFGIPTEPTPKPAGSKQNSSSLTLYGLNQWKDIFTTRQLVALAALTKVTREAFEAILAAGYPDPEAQAIFAYLMAAVDRTADRGSTLCSWTLGRETIRNTFTRFALPITWDFAESLPLSNRSGSYLGATEWIARFLEHACSFANQAEAPSVLCGSSLKLTDHQYDVILTDPPYYDAIQYADLMDFFYVWLRRLVWGTKSDLAGGFTAQLAPKWNHEENDGELIQDPGRFGGDKAKSKAEYESGMYRFFQACHPVLAPSGRLVVVFANKAPDAWETLVSAIIRAGFVVDGSWPIQTERGNRTRALSSAALASSVWLVCRKRSDSARPGWDTTVLSEMKAHIQTKLREYWDAGIRGPDFVWAATGPALEVYSKHPAVKKANVPGELMTVPDFLGDVRRIVVDFIVGQVLYHGTGSATVSGLDDITTYYILHRYDFGLDEAPIGACILYAISCRLSDRELTDRHDLLVRAGTSDPSEESVEADDEAEEDNEAASSSGSNVKLKSWNQRSHKNLGIAVDGRPTPLIDQIHGLMHLWRAGDVVKVEEYMEARALRSSRIFIQLLQALIELAQVGSEERSILESLSNHVATRGVAYDDKQLPLGS